MMITNGNITLYEGDCLEIMPQLIKDGVKVDMILCDLPYGVTKHKDDKRIDFEKLWECYNALITDNGCIVLFAQGMFYVDLVNSNKKMFRYDITWNKLLTSGFLNANRMPLRQHENVAIFYKKPPIYNPQKTKGKPNHSIGIKHKTQERCNRNYGEFKPMETDLGDLKHPTSIVTFQKPHPSKCQHRTEKPVPLLEYFIKTYTNENMVVMDNCMGSGGSIEACVLTNRRGIGIEMNHEIFEVAKNRLKL